MEKLLIVDDDVALSQMLREYFETEGLAVTLAHDGATGVRLAVEQKPDLVMLDVMMPGMDGISALRRLREQSSVPVLMLTAKGDDVDRIVGLELGADDYVPKPCTPRELLARIRAILRRQRPAVTDAPSGEPLIAGPLRMWPLQRRAQFEGQSLTLTGAEFGILEALLSQPGHVMSKADLSTKGLGRPLARFDRSVDVHISSIRQKIPPRPDGSSWIQTIRGQGYLLTLDA